MKLPFSFGQKKEKIEYILALLLRDETASVVVLGENENKLHIVTQRTVQLSTTLEQIDSEELLDTLDKAITTVETKIPADASLHKTVFGVKENWVEEAHIKKDYLAKLKKMSDELELKPIGFLVFSEAISHLLQQEEGAPVSAILVEIGKQATTIALIRGGKITETHTTPNEHPVAKTIETVLASITSVEILPSRILLFDSEESGKNAQHLLSHTWSKELPFLHVPQVSVLPAGFDIKAVLVGTAAQLGFTADTNYQHTATNTDISVTEKKLPENKIASIVETKEEIQKLPTETVTAADMGFVIDQDVAETASDISKDTPVNTDGSHANLNEAIAEIPEEVKEETTGEIDNKDSFPRNGMLLASQMKQFLRNVFSKKKKSDTPPVISENIQKSKKTFNKMLLIFPLLAVLFVAAVVFYIFKEKATVTISITPKVDSETEQVVFTAGGGNNFDSNQITGAAATLTEDGTLQAQATGTQSVGDKAKGTVTIYNPDTTSKTVPAGTTLTSSNGLKFTLDKDVSVASASGDIFSGTKPGTTDGTVTAGDIGTDYNLPSGTKFSVGNSTTVAAKNSNAFSGGTKKQVTIVSKDDESKLLDQLTKNLQDKAQTDMNTQSGDKTLLPVFIDTKVSKKNFDKQVGDQANSVTLTESVAFQGISYVKQDVQDFAENVIKKKNSQNMQLASNGVSADVRDIKQKSNTQIAATVNIKAKLYTKLDINQIKQTIKGDSFDKAENFLNNQPQVSHADITLHPNIPFFPKMLPRSEDNITIVIKNQ